MHCDYYTSPIGSIEIKADNDYISSVYFAAEADLQNRSPNTLTEKAMLQLEQYFEGNLKHFDLPLLQRGTLFQEKVWAALNAIPYGHTCSYGELANKIGGQNNVRAVGAANGKNPLLIVVPCHRVIGASGQLVGYAGGLDRKQWLLNFESRIHNRQLSLL